MACPRCAHFGAVIMHLCVALLACMLSALFIGAPAGTKADGEVECYGIVQDWLSRIAKSSRKQGKANATQPYYFLHIPRTGGRTLGSCLIKPATVGKERKPCRTYEGRATERAQQDSCAFLASHEGYEVAAQLGLPKEQVMTQLRDPVERVLSAYSFAHEVAARLNASDDGGEHSQAAQKRHHGTADGNARRRPKTRRVWPWNYLVHFAERHWPQEERHRLPMSPGEFAASHEVAELLHNGQVFQLLGIANNSMLGQDEGLRGRAQEVRECAKRHDGVMGRLVRAAKRHLEERIGLVMVADEMEESAAMIALHLGVSGADEVGKNGQNLRERWLACQYNETERNQARRRRAGQRAELPSKLSASESDREVIQGLNWADSELHKHAKRLHERKRNALMADDRSGQNKKGKLSL